LADPSPGLYGKVPMLGDFVSRGLPREFVDPWDDWLSRGMARSREGLGEDWLGLYLNGPVWRFVLRPGVLTEMAVAGVLMPSVDAANRHFPLTIAALARAHSVAFSLAVEDDGLFVAAEELALSCLAPEATISSIERGLEQLAPVPISEQPASNSESIGSLGRWQLAGDLPEGLCSVLPHVIDAIVTTAHGPFSLWWTAGSDEVGPALLLFRGLPPGDAFSALLRDVRPETRMRFHAA
jgi:type VI secretion system protein ImpM